MLYAWTVSLPDEAKICEAYQMLKSQGEASAAVNWLKQPGRFIVRSCTVYAGIISFWSFTVYCDLVSRKPQISLQLLTKPNMSVFDYRYCFSWPRNLCWSHIITVTFCTSQESRIWWQEKEYGKKTHFWIFLRQQRSSVVVLYCVCPLHICHASGGLIEMYATGFCFSITRTYSHCPRQTNMWLFVSIFI